MKNPRRQNVTPHHAERRWRSARFRFLDDAVNRKQLAAAASGLDDTILTRRGARDFLHTQKRATLVPIDVDHLLHHRRLGVNQIVGKDNRERMSADYRLRAQHGMAEPERLMLAHINACL